MLCTLQFQPYLLMSLSAPTISTMASSIITSTTAEQDLMPSQQSTAHGKKELGVKVTSSTPNPVPTSVVERYVTDAAEIISATPAYRKMFIAEYSGNAMKLLNGKKNLKKISPGLPGSLSISRKLPACAVYPNYSDGKFIPAGQNKVIDRLLNNYLIPKTSTSPSGSNSTVTVSSAKHESLTTTLTAKPAEAEPSTSQDDSRKKTASSFDDLGCNKSASVLRKRIEEKHPNQALALFVPLGMAEDLTKIQFTLYNEIKTEPKAVKKSVAAIPFSDVEQKVVEATTSLEERTCGLEDKYNELKEIILHRTTQHFNLDLSLLEKWDATVMVLKHSP